MRTAILAAITFTLAAAGAQPPKAAAPAASPRPPKCCFTNPQYAGVCAVEAGEGETCSSIRAYLNNPRSLGKTYCESTTIRGGWKQTRCRQPRAR